MPSSRKVLAAVGVTCALAILPAQNAVAGDWLPLVGCTHAPADTALIAMTFGVTPNFGPIGKVEFIPLSQDGIPSVPVESASCPDGYSCAPDDSIPGAVIFSGLIDFQHYSLLTIQVRTREEPYKARFFNPDGGLMDTKFDVQTCWFGVATPARASSWGRVKSVYR